ncbi:MAG: hypothetical protein GXN96_00185 [Aquificae bacterium]|nr:hypothetical protein [Aquificota bacterium]
MRWLALILLVSGMGFGVCGLDFSVEMKYKVEEKVGKEYRRTDVVLYIPVEGEVQEEEGRLAELKKEVRGEELLLTLKPLRNFNGEWFLVVPLRSGYVHEEAYIEKVISEKPSVKEIYYVYPADISPKKVEFPLPPTSPGEKLLVKLKLKGEVGKPQVRLKESRSKTVKKQKYIKVVYSFNFRYARTDTDNLNIKNLKRLIDQLALVNRLKRVEIIGYADGKTKNLKKNEEVARKRALTIARKLFSEHRVACLVNERGVARLTAK